MTYACQTWTLKNETIRKLQVAQRSIERSILGITRRTVKNRMGTGEDLCNRQSKNWNGSGQDMQRKGQIKKSTTEVILCYPGLKLDLKENPTKDGKMT